MPRSIKFPGPLVAPCTLELQISEGRRQWITPVFSMHILLNFHWLEAKESYDQQKLPRLDVGWYRSTSGEAVLIAEGTESGVADGERRPKPQAPGISQKLDCELCRAKLRP